MHVELAHVSDFHASGSWFDADAFEAGVRRVNDLEVDHVVFTGDLTDHGTQHEYDKTLPLLDRFERPVHAVMGNHDAMREGWRIFADRLLGGERYYTRDLGGLRLFGLDSAEPDVNEGHIGREQMAWFQAGLDAAETPVVVALHHHLMPVPGTGRERNILLDAGEMLRTITDAGVPLVLTGHKHQPWAWNLQGTVIATTGTFCSMKTNCGQNFNHITLADGRLTVDNVDVNTGSRRTLCDVPMEVLA